MKKLLDILVFALICNNRVSEARKENLREVVSKK
jgi:hypothetical protein